LIEYIAQPGDTVYSIARLFSIRTGQLLSVNPGLGSGPVLAAGQRLLIPDISLVRPAIEVNGYFYAGRDPSILREVFPYLTYLSILYCRVTPDGGILCMNDSTLVRAVRAANVAPMMVVTNYTPGEGYSEPLVHAILSDPQAQQTLMQNILSRLRKTQYYGINIDFEMVPYADYNALTQFVQMASFTLHPLGYLVMVTVRTKRLIDRAENQRDKFRITDYTFIADRFVIKTSELACDPNTALSQTDSMQRILDYITGPFSSQKVLVAYPNCCRMWTLPYQPGQQPQPVFYEQAELIANQAGTGFEYDMDTGMLFFDRVDDTGAGFTIWCGNVVANKDIMELVRIYNLGGVSVRPVDLFSVATFQLFGAMYQIQKLNL